MTSNPYDKLPTKDFAAAILSRALSEQTEIILGRIDNLAQSISIDFQTVEGKIAVLTERVDTLEKRVDNLEDGIIAIHDYFSAVFIEIGILREEMADTDTRAEIIDIEGRINRLERNITPKTARKSRRYTNRQNPT